MTSQLVLLWDADKNFFFLIKTKISPHSTRRATMKLKQHAPITPISHKLIVVVVVVVEV